MSSDDIAIGAEGPGKPVDCGRAFLAAVQFLTRVPVPAGTFPDAASAQAAVRVGKIFFPLVGTLIGLVTATVIWTAGHLWPIWLAVPLGLAVEALLTGAFHEDAVADFCDAFGGGWARDDVLRILRDSRIGSFGTVGLVLALLLRAGGLTALEPGTLFAGTVASATLGRWVILWVMAALPPVVDRPGLSHEVGARMTVRSVLLGGLLSIPGCLALAVLSPGRLLLALLLLALLAWWFVRYVDGRLGGVTGDCLGCVCYLGQIVVLLAVAARPVHW